MTKKLTITAKDVPGLRERLEDPRPVLISLGALMLAKSQASFEDQSYGGQRWPERYEGSPEPFVNVAGALSDLNRNRQIKSRRFDRRPAGIDVGTMRNALSFELKGKRAVTVGSTAPHAAQQVFGLESVQKVTDVARDRLTKEYRRYKKQGGSRFQAIKKLGFLHSVSELRTEIQERPHIGLYPDLERELVSEVEEYIAES